ncbi:hypothetical protein SSBR45G_55150 [Bradyrhizobium sp. SSBR45G]|uniref:hypothetical protein n=1 Tax=unclassified Bradyrhizobium TaxID=2631580 RepID=UPI0023428C96|nr:MULTISPECIES: hypothetical protein [unclassified Bradyrhizobium]GLH80606.1 hypothetical protein SSBR45G_55150 [Bradyrhizobium sp. SSBR45G]GLH85812.1 hypothetical protein SSBR45R_32720 [Bradyrhizobium sp. SSBR45R]
MLARFLLGTVTAGAMVAPALAGSMTADEARKFVSGKVFAFTCVDGTRGAGRILDDMGATGAVQFSGSGPVRHIRLPGNTLQIRGQNVCASIKGMPFEPCFNLDKKDDRSFRGSVSGLGAFAYCDFQHQGGATMLMARAVARPRTARAAVMAVDPSHTEVAARVETPRVERSKVEPVKSESVKSESAKSESAKAENTKSENAKPENTKSETAKPETAKSDAAVELRRSTE